MKRKWALQVDAGIVVMVAFLAAGSARAATNFVCKIRAAGQAGDYTNLSTWEAAIQSDLTATTSKVFTVSDMGTYVASDDGSNVTFTGSGTGILKHINMASNAYIVNAAGTVNPGTVTVSGSSHTFAISDAGDQIGLAVAECYNDWTNGLEEAATVTIDGWTTASNHYIKVCAPQSERHTGRHGTGFRLISPASSWALNNLEHYTVIEGLGFDGSKYTYTYGLSLTHYSPSTDYGTVRNCVFYDHYYHAIAVGEYKVSRVYNNMVIGVRSSSYKLVQGSSNTDHILEIYNNTFYNCTIDVGYGGPGSCWARNNIFYNCSSPESNSNYSTNSYKNVSSNSFVPGSDADNYVNQTTNDIKFVSIASGSLDLHIKARSCAWDRGVNLSGLFTTDIDGDRRSGVWDIGADETQGPCGTVFRIH